MSIAKVLLSGSTGGKQIKVAATATAGTTIHTTGVSASVIDEVWLYATNQDTVHIALTVEWGGTASPDDLETVTIPPKAGATILTEGKVLTGDGSAGRTIRAFAGTANKVLVHGFVNRIA